MSKKIRAYSTSQPTEIVIFDDKFDDPTLGSNWVISPGRGNYSLTDNPGYLRYIIDANHTARMAGSGQDYAKSLWLVRPFSGDRWILKTAVTYNMRPAPPTNNRNMNFTIRSPGTNGVAMLQISRSVGVNDNNPGSNSMYLFAGNTENLYFPNSPNPLPAERWYFEIERNKDYVAVRASRGDDDSTFEYLREYTFPPGSFGNDQEIEIEGDGWDGSNDPAGYADFDFIKIVQLQLLENFPAGIIDGVGEGIEKRLEKQGIKTVNDLASSDVFALYKNAGIPLLTFYGIKRKARLALDVEIKKALFGNIRQMQLGEIIAIPDEELSRKTNQPVEVISDLKMSISTLLVSLDNAIVRAMTLEKLAT